MAIWKKLDKQHPTKDTNDLILLDNFGVMHHGHYTDGCYFYWLDGGWYEYEEPKDGDTKSNRFIAYMQTKPFNGFTDIPSLGLNDGQKNLTYEEFVEKMEDWHASTYKANRIASNVMWLCAEYPEYAKTYRDSLGWATMD